MTENESGSLHHQLSEFVRLLSPPLLICTHWESSARESNLHCVELSTIPKQCHADVRIMRQLLIRGSLRPRDSPTLGWRRFAIDTAIKGRRID